MIFADYVERPCSECNRTVSLTVCLGSGGAEGTLFICRDCVKEAARSVPGFFLFDTQITSKE
jgi:ribosomal protein S14